MWHVSVFFVIAGFFLKEEKLKAPITFFKNKLRTIYFKTLCFYIPAVLLHNVFIKIGFYSTDIDYYGKIVKTFTGADLAKKIIETVLLAGREPIVGPLWFAYVLFIALIGYSIVSFVIGKFFKDNNYWIAKGLVLFALSMCSCILTNKYSITLNRFSNSISVMFLIYLGQLFNIRLKLTYNSWFAFVGSILLFLHGAILSGGIHLNNNDYKNVFHLICAGGGTAYMFLFIAKRISETYLGRIIAIIGEYSFSIMALHLLSFKLCTIILNKYDLFSTQLEYLTPGTGKNYFIALLYLLTGIFLPLIFIRSLEFAKNCVSTFFQKKQ